MASIAVLCSGGDGNGIRVRPILPPFGFLSRFTWNQFLARWTDITQLHSLISPNACSDPLYLPGLIWGLLIVQTWVPSIFFGWPSFPPILLENRTHSHPSLPSKIRMGHSTTPTLPSILHIKLTPQTTYFRWWHEIELRNATDFNQDNPKPAPTLPNRQWDTNWAIKWEIRALTWWMGVLGATRSAIPIHEKRMAIPHPHPKFSECGGNPSFLGWGTPVCYGNLFHITKRIGE